MSNRVEQLLIRIGLIDNLSGPANNATSAIGRLTERAMFGAENVLAGGFGLSQVGSVLTSILEPVKEMDSALGEVASLGVENSALEQLERTALQTSIQYGVSASDMVRSSYDIQSAIAGLTGNELSSFTRTSAVLAQGTKSDAAVITDYMGTMYGIFQNTAMTMGKTQWVEALAGQTATAVQMFKTQGSEMASAFGNLGAEGQSLGVDMAEQMAVLGTLQATMSGSEAGTKYKSFLGGVGKAQEALNLKFVDANDKILPMVDILEKIQGKYGEIDTVAKSDILKNAFGTKEATGLIKLLSQNTGKLADDIYELGNIQGMGKAVDMATAIADPWERLAATGVALQTVLGRAIMPILIPLIDKLLVGGETLTRWTDMFPHLTRAVGIATLVILGLVATVSTFALIGGIAQLSMAGLSTVMVVGTTVVWLYSTAMRVATATMAFFRAAALVGAIHFALLSGAMGTSTAATWLFNSALWANPITWVVAGVIALVAALVTLALNWDSVTTAATNFAIRTVTWVNSLLSAFNKIPEWWQNFKNWLTALNPFSSASSGVDALMDDVNKMPDIQMGSTILGQNDGIQNGGIQQRAIPSAAYQLPGFDINSVLTHDVNVNHRIPAAANSILHSSSDMEEKANAELHAMRVATPSLTAPTSNTAPLSQIYQQSTQNTQNDHGTNIEKIEINTTQTVDGYLLADELAMAAG